MSPTGTLLSTLSPRSRVLLGVAAAIGAFARIAVYATAWTVSRERLATTTIVGIVAALAWLIHRATLSAARPDIEHDLHRATSRALLEGDVVAVASDDLHRAIWDGHHHARTLVGQSIPAVVADATAVAVVVPLVASTFEARVLFVAAAALGVLALTALALRRLDARLQASVLTTLQRVDERLTTAIEGRLEIVARGGEAAYAASFDAALAAYRRHARRAALASAIVGRVPLAAGIGVVVIVTMLDAGARTAVASAVFSDALTLAAATSPLLGMVMGAHELTRTSGRARAFAGLLMVPRRADATTRGVAPSLPAEIVAESVSFAYAEDRTRVLDDVSFRWSPGEVLVVVGPNGSGKSTLLRLLLGLRSPSAGALRVGGRPLAEIDVVALRRRASFLPQRPYLGEPYATVRDAMRLTTEGAADDALRGALARVGVSVGLDDVVGELSAGQRQRVALARICVQDTPLILLDEPDANLDRDGIALVSRLVTELAGQGKMIAVAAHTPELASLDGRTVRLEARA